MNLDFGYWLFSTLTQSLAALFAVVGVFLVFKIQLLNERIRPLMEVAKTTYIEIKKIIVNTASEEYRKVTVYTPEEMIAKLKELIKHKEENLISNKDKAEELTKQGNLTFPYNENVERIKKEIAICNERLNPLERVNQALMGIRNKGKISLIEICSGFIISLIFLFLNPFIPQWLIKISGSIFITGVVFIVCYAAKIIFASLDNKEGINE